MGKNLSNKVVFSHKLSCRCEEVHSSPIKVTDFRLMRSLVGTFLVFALGLTCHPVSADVSVNLANYLTYGTCPSGDPEYPNQGYVTPYGCWNPDLGFIVSSGLAGVPINLYLFPNDPTGSLEWAQIFPIIKSHITGPVAVIDNTQGQLLTDGATGTFSFSANPGVIIKSFSFEASSFCIDLHYDSAGNFTTASDGGGQPSTITVGANNSDTYSSDSFSLSGTQSISWNATAQNANGISAEIDGAPYTNALPPNCLGADGGFVPDGYVTLSNPVVIVTTASPSPSPASSPELSIDAGAVVVSQAVSNFTLSGQSRVTLVQGKNAAIIVPIGVSSPNPSDQTPVTVIATMPDGTTATSSPIPMASIGPATGPIYTQVNIVPVAINSSGQGDITLQASAGDAVSGSATVPVIVKQTNPLGVVYVPISGFFGNISADPAGPVEEHQKESDYFMAGAFPVAENGIQSSIYNGVLTGTQNLNIGLNDEMNEDLLLTLLAGVRSNPSARNAVGIVPQNYFSMHDAEGVKGITPAGTTTNLGAPVSLVTNGYWSTTAHEIGHTYGMPDLYLASANTTVNGYWVDQLSQITNAFDLMFGESAELKTFNTWISSNNYATIFQAQLTNPHDPQVIIVSGSVNKAGAVTLQPTYFSPNGVASSYNKAQNSVVQTVSSDGTVVAQSSFNTSFVLEDSLGQQHPTSASIFLTQLPLSQSVDSVQIIQSGKTLTSFNPSAQLLGDTIKNISPESFISTPKQEEGLFLNEAKNIESVIEICSKIKTKTGMSNWEKVVCNDATVELLLNFRHQLSGKLNNSTAVTSPLQVTKMEVFSVVDGITLQMLGNISVDGSSHAFEIRVLPPDSTGILSIESFTQGAYGSVSINKDGTIQYKPTTDKPMADSFTVTLQNSEGSTVNRIVSVVLPCENDGVIGRWKNRFQ